MTLTIPDWEVTGHGNDMHASQMSAGNFESVNPGETSQYCYIAEYAGIFKYHCSGVNLIGMDQHVLSGTELQSLILQMDTRNCYGREDKW